MLQLLHIENIAVIESADISFGHGFHALTGETGAGKSIVIDALGAVLGQRTSRDLIRTGAQKAYVSALFSNLDDLVSLMEGMGVSCEQDGTLLLQRELFADGRNICRAGERPITVAQLHTIGQMLLNIHGQHDGQQLLDEKEHIAYLDRFGTLEQAKETYGEHYAAMCETKREIESLQMNEAQKAMKVDALQFQIAELERAALKPGEDELIQSRLVLMRNAEKYLSALSGADAALNGGDEMSGAVSALEEAQAALQSIRSLDGAFGELLDRMEAARCEVYDLAMTVRDKRSDFDFSPEELDELESRADTLYRIKKKYGATVEECIDYLEKSKKELDDITYADDKIAMLQGVLSEKMRKVTEAAEMLRNKRKAAAERLEEQILSELRELDMPKVQFSIAFSEKEPSENGADEVRFLMSANVGEALKPIDRVASGGELARIMLALKNVLAEQDCVGTLVFDEVDTGVSGRAAQRVAEKLAKVSRKKQVLCVTHLPQLAAMADTHMSVEKGEKNGRTYTQVSVLDRKARCMELARLTGGEIVSEAILAGADELLSSAEQFKSGL